MAEIKKKKKFQTVISVSIAKINTDQIESEERFVCSQIRTKHRNKRKNYVYGLNMTQSHLIQKLNLFNIGIYKIVNERILE